MIYGGTRGHVFAIHPTTGQEKWRTKLSTGFFNAVAYEDVTVLLRDGIVIAASKGHVFDLSAETGEMLWHNGLGGLGHEAISLATDRVAVQYVHRKSRS